MSSVQILLRNTAHNSIVCFMINPKVSWSEDPGFAKMYHVSLSYYTKFIHNLPTFVSSARSSYSDDALLCIQQQVTFLDCTDPTPQGHSTCSKSLKHDGRSMQFRATHTTNTCNSIMQLTNKCNNAIEVARKSDNVYMGRKVLCKCMSAKKGLRKCTQAFMLKREQ